MIKYMPYSMFDAFDDSQVQTVVNTINCMGIMGKGLALEFKIRYPNMFDDYIRRHKEGNLNVGEPYVFKTSNKWILNFPTKNHWKYPSKLEFIDSGLKFFVESYKKFGIKSVAFPRLGCTFGGLKWEQVKPLMEKYIGDIQGIDVYVYLDQKASDKEQGILEAINSCNKADIRERFKLSDRQIDALKIYIQRRGLLKRLRDLLEIKGIGPAAYKKALSGRNQAGMSQGEFLF